MQYSNFNSGGVHERVSIFLAAAFIAFGATPVSAQVEMTVPEVASRC
jgi:hypothetical protein